MIQQKLLISSELKTLLKGCDEIWIAVAMISDKGFEIIQKNICPESKQNYLVGIGLPTSPNVLEKLLELNDSENFESKIYHKSNKLFHPKSYLIRHGEKLTAIVGSGNCTAGGFEKNIELSIKTDDVEFCNGLRTWFISLSKQGRPLTTDFIDSYKLLFESRKDRMRKDRQEIEVIFSDNNSSFDINKLDLSNQFFKKEHFRAFEGSKPWDSSKKINEERKNVQKQLYKLNDLVLPLIKKKGLDLHEHYIFDDVVSSAVHGQYTSNELGGIWLHYGRGKKEIKSYGKDHTPLDYMRLQVIIHYDSIGIWNRIGKDNGSRIDRDNLKSKLKNDSSYRNKLFNSIKNLPSEYFILLNNTKKHVDELKNEKQLTEYLLEADYRYYFIIGIELKPNHKKLSETNISNTIIENFELLYPTYKMIKHELGY
jgi:hypothetical protein